MSETSSISTLQIPIMVAKTHVATRCLVCDETIDLGTYYDKADVRYICDKCKAAIRWARYRMNEERRDNGKRADDE